MLISSIGTFVWGRGYDPWDRRRGSDGHAWRLAFQEKAVLYFCQEFVGMDERESRGQFPTPMPEGRRSDGRGGRSRGGYHHFAEGGHAAEMKDFFNSDFWKQALATVAGGVILFFVLKIVRGK